MSGTKVVKSGNGAFGITVNSGANPGVAMKVNIRMKDIFHKYKEFDEPQRVVCDKVIIDPSNRGGQPPDMHYLHFDLEPNQEKDGFDKLRPKPGVLRNLMPNAEERERCIQHNRDLMEGTNGLFPPLFADIVEFGCLASNHMTLSHRGIKHGLVSSLTGRKWKVPSDDDSLDEIIKIGLQYWVMRWDLPVCEAKLVSDWHNSDQNQNAGNGDAFLHRMVLTIVNEELIKTPLVKISQIIARYTANAIVQVNTNAVASIGKMVLAQGAGQYVEEWLIWLSKSVNSTQLTCPPQWFEEMCKIFETKYVLVKLVTKKIHYSGEVKVINQRPIPDMTKFITVPEMTAVAKNKDNLDGLEDFFRHGRNVVEPVLAKHIGKVRGRDLMDQLEQNAGRLVYAKSLTKHCIVSPKVVGKFSIDKLTIMRENWADYCEKTVPDVVGFALECGIKSICAAEPPEHAEEWLLAHWLAIW